MISIKERTALITGSSRGIGQQIAKGLASLGCHVIIHGRTLESTSDTKKILKQYPITVYQVYGELSKENQVKSLIKQVKELEVPIDIVYNNAAIMTNYHTNIFEHSWDDWIETFKVNVISMYDICGAFLPDMIEHNFGRIVNITSGIKDQPELAPYSASKWAVRKLTDDLASKLNNTGVRINTLDPGWLKTDMGGEQAEHPVEKVLPGALAPVLIDDDGPNGELFSAINHNLKL